MLVFCYCPIGIYTTALWIHIHIHILLLDILISIHTYFYCVNVLDGGLSLSQFFFFFSLLFLWFTEYSITSHFLCFWLITSALLACTHIIHLFRFDTDAEYNMFGIHTHHTVSTLLYFVVVIPLQLQWVSLALAVWIHDYMCYHSCYVCTCLGNCDCFACRHYQMPLRFVIVLYI